MGIELPALRGDHPMAVLCAWGALDLLGRHHDPAATLRWTASHPHWRAVITTRDAGDVDSLAAALHSALGQDDIAGLTAVAPDLNKVMPESFAEALLAADDEQASARHLLVGLAAEHPPRPNGQAPMTPLAITSFQGKRSFFQATLKADASTTLTQIREVIQGPWIYRKNVATLNLDPTARQQDSARLGVDASGDGTRGVAGALALAVRGLSLIPPLPAYGRSPRAPWMVARHFVWPVWTADLTRAGVAALLGRSWAEDVDGRPRRRRSERGRAIAEGCSVRDVVGSAIVPAKDGSRLARARTVP